ncbi:MAG: carboxypeptidase-like regulatory domain-containing protein [Candidatus Thiodiazotropha sp.]
MKNRKLMLLVAVCVAAVVVVVMFWPSVDLEPVPQSGSLGFGTEKRTKLKAVMVAFEQAKAKHDEGRMALAFEDFAEELGGRAGKMLRMARDRNLPVKMYGRVVDQHGQPVAGAKVQMVISGGGTYAPGTGRTYFVTDEHGLFEVAGKGQRISILDVEHPQLSAVYFKHFGLDRKDIASDLDAVGTYGAESSWRTYDSPEKAYVIPVWRVEKFEKVVRNKGGFIPEPNGQADKYVGIVASCGREPMEPGVHWKDQKGSWSITFRPIEGGIQETNDFYLNEAPEGGYQPELTVSMERGSPDYKVVIYKPKSYYYYYMDKGKRIYGSLEASFNPYRHKSECRVTTKVKYNPSGSRNLATRKRR